MEAVITSIVIVALVFMGMWAYFHFSAVEITNKSMIVPTIRDGLKETKYTLAIPKSENQPDGMTFSYAGWIRIDDFTHNFGAQKIVFAKGSDDATVACPALLLDANTNTFIVKIDTFGTQELVPISNIPAKKWLHFAITVDQNAVNVYINGTLHTHHTLNQLPRQNTGPVYITPKGGFEGKVGMLEYYPYMLSPDDVAIASTTSPQPDSSDKDVEIMPPYFAPSWWVTRGQQK